MPRAYCIPGVFFLVCAFVLSFLASISLPWLTALDITRVHAATNAQAGSVANAISEARFGVWAYCVYDAKNGARTCSPTGHGYSYMAQAADKTITIGSSWTRGLAVHPVATAVTFFAMLLSFSQHITLTLVASFLSFLAALLTLIAFAIDIALYAFVNREMNKLGVGARTVTAPGFWITFASLVLLLLGGCTVCFGRRRDRMAGANSYAMSGSKKPFWKRFGRN